MWAERPSWRRARGELMLACCLLGCTASQDAGEPVPERVATPAALVNGEAIAIEEVRELVRASGLPPKRALERLVAERLLAQYAAERGYGEHVEVQRGGAQERVHLLLAQAVEAGSDAGDVATRRTKLELLLAELARRTPVTYHEATIARALADPRDE